MGEITIRQPQVGKHVKKNRSSLEIVPMHDLLVTPRNINPN